MNNHASDDAAGLAISSQLSAGARVLNQAIRNINDGISLTSIAESALNSLSDITIRQMELAEEAANGTYSSTQRSALQKEATELTKEFNRIIEGATFNGRRVLTLMTETSRSRPEVESKGHSLSTYRLSCNGSSEPEHSLREVLSTTTLLLQ